MSITLIPFVDMSVGMLIDESRLYKGPNHFNPSIVHYGDGYLFTYRIQNRPDGPTDNYICRMSLGMMPQMSHLIKPPGGVPRLSDMRLFWHGSELMCSYSVLDGPRWRQGLACITPEGVLTQHRYVSISPNSHQKNYQFFSQEGKLYAISAIQPEHIILEVETGRIHRSKTDENWIHGQPRGGTPPVEFNGLWLSGFHSSLDGAHLGLKQVYYAGWYAFEKHPPFRVVAMSKKSILDVEDYEARKKDKIAESQRRKAVVFPCGLVHHRKGLLVTYGLNDVAPAYRVFSNEEVHTSLHERNLITWRKNNFGDKLSRIIVSRICGEEVLGNEVCTTKNSGSNRLLALGTIFHRAKDGDVIWGSGLGNHLKHGEKYVPQRNLNILAVRGPLTRDLYLNGGGDSCPEVYGDPAILLPDIYTPKPERGGVAILPHVNDHTLRRRFPDLSFIDPACRDPLAVVDAVAGKELVITSSLHGLIVSEAYGVPAVLYFNQSGSFREPEFKYRDYFASTGRVFACLSAASLADVLCFADELLKPVFPDKQLLKRVLTDSVARATSDPAAVQQCCGWMGKKK